MPPINANSANKLLQSKKNIWRKIHYNKEIFLDKISLIYSQYRPNELQNKNFYKNVSIHNLIIHANILEKTLKDWKNFDESGTIMIDPPRYRSAIKNYSDQVNSLINSIELKLNEIHLKNQKDKNLIIAKEILNNNKQIISELIEIYSAIEEYSNTKYY